MLIPSIDLMNGNAVQLVGGREPALDAGDPRPIAKRFAPLGEVAVIDLDAALGRGSNADTIRDLLSKARCRVGGGIRDADAAIRWLDAGAARVILGTAARPDVLRELPRERVIAALDARDGEVVVHGWQTPTGRTVIDCMHELRPYVSGFLVTFVEREGRMAGIDLPRIRTLRDAAGDAELTYAGGVTTPDDVAALDALGVDAQVGMALYTGRLDLTAAFAAPLQADRADRLWPTVVVDEHGVALGLAWSSLETLREAVESRRGVYHSRTRGRWLKGESSGATQELLRVDVDCDRDALRFTVRQQGAGFCHRQTWSCWGAARGLPALARTLAARRSSAPPGSYARRLFDDPALLNSKLLEEAGELNEALDACGVSYNAGDAARDAVVAEAADLLFFTLTACTRAGVTLAEVERELDRRTLHVTRRPGDAKPAATDQSRPSRP